MGLALSSSFAISLEILRALFYTVFRIRIGSGFNQVSGSGSGSRRKNYTQKLEKNLEISCFEMLDVFLTAEGFFCSLDVLYEGLGLGKLQFLIIKYLIVFSAVHFSNLWSSKPWIRIGTIQPKMLDPDPDQMNTGYGSVTQVLYMEGLPPCPQKPFLMIYYLGGTGTGWQLRLPKFCTVESGGGRGR